MAFSIGQRLGANIKISHPGKTAAFASENMSSGFIKYLQCKFPL
jgi:hypothetical protein